jgi:hypothetical protein
MQRGRVMSRSHEIELEARIAELEQQILAYQVGGPGDRIRELESALAKAEGEMLAWQQRSARNWATADSVGAERDTALAKPKEAEGLLRDWITPDIGTTRRLDRVTREYLASLGEAEEPAAEPAGEEE